MPFVFMLFNLLTFLVLSLPHTNAIGIEFTKPTGGATLPAGPITIEWADAGGNPDLQNLTTYASIVLMVGGNQPQNSQGIQKIGQDGAQVSDLSVQDTIQADIAESIQNGFYLMMTSNTSSGNQVINYSERFTLIQMNGTTADEYLNGANQAAGSVSNVPAAQYNIVTNTAASASSTSSTSSTSSSTTSQASPTSTNAADDDDTELSSSAVAGLIAGGILALIGLISLIVWTLFFARKFRRRHQAQHAKNLSTSDSSSDLGHPSPAFIGHKAELPANSSSSRGELSPTAERFELHGFDKAVEAPTETVFELEGSIGLYEAGSGRRTQLWDPI